MDIRQLLSEKKDLALSEADTDFIAAFDDAMRKIGYENGGVGPGFCWGRYMLIYTKAGVKSKKTVARVYIRDHGILLRMYFSNIDRHAEYIMNAPEFIRLPFTGSHGGCHHCHNEKEGKCKFRKTYRLDNRLIEKCNGVTFEFDHPDTERLPEYMGLLKEFRV